MDTMEYKGYRGAVRYSADDRLLHGRILGIEDVVSFEGAEVEELENAFREAVDDYLALCEKLGRDPDREYSGRIPLRIDAALHRRVAIAADLAAKSVNSWIADTLVLAITRKRRNLDISPTGSDLSDQKSRSSRCGNSSRRGRIPRAVR